jgi:hypothetical protein
MCHGWEAPVLLRIVEIVERRATWLMEIAAPSLPRVRMP